MTDALTGARRLDTIIKDALRDTRLSSEDRSALESLRAQAQHATKTLDTPQQLVPGQAAYPVADWVGLIAARTQELLGNYEPAGRLAAELQVPRTAVPPQVDLVPTPIPMPARWRERRSPFDRLGDAVVFGMLPAWLFLILSTLVNATLRWIFGYGFTDAMPVAVAIPVLGFAGLLLVAGIYSQYRLSGEEDPDDDWDPNDAPLATGKSLKLLRNR